MVGLSLYASVTRPLTLISQRRGTLVPKKAMGELVTNIAALPVRVVRVIVNDCSVPATGHCNRRKR